MTDAIVAGLISGIISPLIVSYFQHKWIWRTQKELETKFSIFQEAVKALSMHARDALDPKLQSNPAVYNGHQRPVEMTPATNELIQISKGMIKTFYSQEAYAVFERAVAAKISINNVPNEEFYAAFTNAVLIMGKELGAKK